MQGSCFGEGLLTCATSMHFSFSFEGFTEPRQPTLKQLQYKNSEKKKEVFFSISFRIIKPHPSSELVSNQTQSQYSFYLLFVIFLLTSIKTYLK